MVTFKNLSHWLGEISRYSTDNVVKLLVGNKTDLTEKRAVDYKTAKDFADSLGLHYVESSAKDSQHVSEIFNFMAKEIKEKFVVR